MRRGVERRDGAEARIILEHKLIEARGSSEPRRDGVNHRQRQAPLRAPLAAICVLPPQSPSEQSSCAIGSSRNDTSPTRQSPPPDPSPNRCLKHSSPPDPLQPRRANPPWRTGSGLTRAIAGGASLARTKPELCLAASVRFDHERGESPAAALASRTVARARDLGEGGEGRGPSVAPGTAPSSNLKILTINNFSNRLVLKISIRRFPFLEKYYHKIVNSLEFMNMSDVKLWDKVIKIIKTNLIL